MLIIKNQLIDALVLDSGKNNMSTILLLEDDQGIREMIHIVLESENYNVISFCNIADFSNRDKKIEADLFLLDIRLPDGSGLAVCHEINAVQNTPVLVMSAHARLEEIESKCQPANFIQKPFDIDYLLSQVKKYIN
ncbi:MULTISPECIES: response regulator [unclassified Pedobacter]|uniref:response regulator n=1 Tax=unclassified Pedobacter TaxID=2628915 RepID=UPI001E3C0D07|nr:MULTISPECIES: response regulator [unclassified Pedobacter]